MGVHIFDTPYTALQLDVPETIRCKCRKPNGFGHPEHNEVTYQFPGTRFTTEKLKWVWYDGKTAPTPHEQLSMPNGEKLPDQGAMFIGEKGKLLLPHIGYPKLMVTGKFEKIDFPELTEIDHYHQFVDACLGNGECSAPFSYASKLTEAILLGVVANRFPNKKLRLKNDSQTFTKAAANKLLDAKYREF
jgi:hypothetical protein